MISFNHNDWNMTKIEALVEASLGRHEGTNLSFRIYGLKQNQPDAVLLEPHKRTEKLDKKLDALMRWFERNDIRLAVSPANNIGCENCNCDCFGGHKPNPKIKIGIRRDVRERPKFAASLLLTIISFIEGKLTLKRKFKIPARAKRS